ncbi:MAG TPA: hypothetical protein DCY03_12130 [Planctomycetaceae bacterium]|uniref:hypothetical protein n=1 Tax=Gimesia sp. TaxID=2024833 RepID=UPI000E83C573|nr:hypothetical protein [Planctomycetaceae bacterium]
MDENEYRVWRRRIHMSERYNAEAAFAEASGNDTKAAEHRKNAAKFLRGAVEMEKHEKNGWVLTLIRPLWANDVQPIFVGPTGLVENPANAVCYNSFTEACESRTSPKEITNRFPEPLSYHLELYKNSNTE